MLIVIGHLNPLGALPDRQRRRIHLVQMGDGSGNDSVGIAVLGRQVEQHHRNISVGQMRGNLRAHDPRT